MATNLPSYQNGTPHQIDNHQAPKPITAKSQHSVIPYQDVIVKARVEPVNLEDFLGNIRASLANLR
jgi:hypothetical protein